MATRLYVNGSTLFSKESVLCENGVVSAGTPESWTSMYPGVIEMPNAGTPESCKCSGGFTIRFVQPASLPPAHREGGRGRVGEREKKRPRSE
jgi:hypothetical protein